MPCNCGGGTISTPVGTVPNTARNWSTPPGKKYRVVLPNGVPIDARDRWDAAQKKAMYGGRIEEYDPAG